MTVVLTTHYMDEAERLADQVHIIDHGRLIASGTPARAHPRRRPRHDPAGRDPAVPAGSPASLRARWARRPRSPSSTRSACSVTGPADASTLAKVSRWCEENDVLPESLTLGQRTLEDVFLELTGTGASRRERHDFTPRPGAAPLRRQVLAQARMESRLMLRNGEQLLLAVVIPVLVLIGGVTAGEHLALDLATSRPRSTSSPPACSRWR